VFRELLRESSGETKQDVCGRFDEGGSLQGGTQDFPRKRIEGKAAFMSPLLQARMILAKHGIDTSWSPNAICAAVVARLPKASDRRLFNTRVEGCGTHAELVELAATTLSAFEHRLTPLRPPPVNEARDRVSDDDETLEGLRTPYSVR
jgi:hypothetical protein